MNEKILIDCVNYFTANGIYAYIKNNSVYVDIKEKISVELSADEILKRAEIYKEIKEQLATESLFNIKDLRLKKTHF